ncbi:hypothetical protein [Exiguobacterium profundum]
MINYVVFGYISIIIFFILLVLLMLNVMKHYRERKEAGFKRQALNSIVSLILIIGSFVFFAIAAFNIVNGKEATVQMALSSMLLTIGYASLIYFEQYIENQITTQKNESNFLSLLESLQQASPSKSEVSTETSEVKNSVKIMILEIIKSEVENELER